MLDRRDRNLPLTRRGFLHGLGTAAIALNPVLRSWGDDARAAKEGSGPAAGKLCLNREWYFGGRLPRDGSQAGSDGGEWEPITLPHTVVPLSWQQWDPARWEDEWIYRRRISIPSEFEGLRLFLCFDRVMAAASPVLNGHALPQHFGGFLPFEYEVTDLVQRSSNLLSVTVDSRWLNVPPSGSPKGPASVDYLLPGGICGSVNLKAVPGIFISDVFAKPLNVLDPSRRVDVVCRIDCAEPLPASICLEARLLDGDKVVSRESTSVNLENREQEVTFTLSNLSGVNLWSAEKPQLYKLAVTAFHNERPLHRFTRRIGFRDARFDVDGFFFNGSRLRIFGLNRHELYPYLGFAAPERLLRRDAEILRHRFNCNMVRCSHYPQSEAFLDACDELGLMVWEEVPGWQYVGDERWRDLLVRDAEAMVRRDRSHASIVIWGVRVNESANDVALYRRTTDLVKSLDDSRPTSGSMTPDSRKTWQTGWHEDVFAFDDYHSDPDGSVGIDPPLPGVPYLLAEAVGQRTYGGAGFRNQYRRARDPELQQKQALYHAEAHSKAGGFPRCAGVIAWCGFDYASLMNSYEGVKCPGVADVFRLPKLGAAFYLSQVAPEVRPMIEPNFYWDAAIGTPFGSPKYAAIFSNCDRLEVFVAGERHVVLRADRGSFPHIAYPPFFVDLDANAADKPELRIDGYVGNSLVLSRNYSADRSADRLWFHVDDELLLTDGADVTRLDFGAVDRFGNPRATMTGAVRLYLDGPGLIVGDNPFDLNDAGGLGAVYIRTKDGEAGLIRVRGEHPVLGGASAQIRGAPMRDPC